MKLKTLRRGAVLAAVPVPIDSRGEIHDQALRHLVSSLAQSAVQGIAIGTSPWLAGRLSDEQQAMILTAWREGLSAGKFLLVSVGAPREVRRPPEVIESARAVANLAASLGADALHIQPPGSFRGRPDRDRLILEYHAAIAQAGLPLLISYRRESLGGIAYGPEILAQLLARPEVLGVEITTIDGIATFQQVEALTREYAPGKLVVSGEERFLGYSLMSGADGAMVGVAAIEPSLVAELLEAYFTPDAARFLTLSARVDALARPIFRPPLEGSSIRLIQALKDRGTIPSS